MGMSDWSSVYSRIMWKNKRAGGTALNATNLNTGDIALKEIDDRILVLRDSKFNSDSASGLVKDWSIDTSTGVITVTWYNNTTQVYDLNIEKIPVSFSMSENGVITMVTEDGTEFTADIKSVVPIYSFVGSETVSITPSTGTNGEKVFTFSVVEGSIADKYIRPDYLADIKVSESNASQSETNAKTYAEQAKASAESIGIATTTNVGTVKPDGTTISVDTDGTIHVVSSGSPSASAVEFDSSSLAVLEGDNVQSVIENVDSELLTLNDAIGEVGESLGGLKFSVVDGILNITYEEE